MSLDNKTIRLNTVIRELNISLEKVVEYLVEKGIEIDARPTTKISGEIYNILLDGFQSDRTKKEAADKIRVEIQKNEKEKMDLQEKKVCLNDFLSAYEVSLEEAIQYLKDLNWVVEIEDNLKISVAELNLLVNEFKNKRKKNDPTISINTGYKKITKPILKRKTIDLKQFENSKKMIPKKIVQLNRQPKTVHLVKTSNELVNIFKKSDTELVDFLKMFWNTEILNMTGVFEKSTSPNETEYGYVSKTMINDRKAIYPKFVKKRAVSIRIPLSNGLKVGSYYKVFAKLAPYELREELQNPYLLVWDETQPVVEIEGFLPPKEFIKERFFEKGHTPSDASTIASQLSLNELELYTHTKRFIFELIQNADDMPRENKPVNAEIFLTENHLLFLHDGKFFDREDVSAICDAAKSTKKSNIAQTGYKGIGFKSVFTDSSRVYIKSGSYSFKFDKKEPIYSNFWKLYSGYYNNLSDEAKNRFKANYSGKENEFLQIDKIPWQIKPIWVEHFHYSEELKSSPFYNGGHQVSIALDVGSKIINDAEKDYHRMINQLIDEPRFLLFLRNTVKLSYKRLFPIAVDDDVLEVHVERSSSALDVYKNKDQIASYLKKDISVSLDNEAFLKAGLNFQKTEKKGKIVYVDLDGRVLDNIPEKLVYLKETIISFAAQVNKSYINSIENKESILFNYLPTSDSRFGFHFLVNADFVSKTDREFIQIENKWNHYLFYNIGLSLIFWLSELAEVKNKEKLYKYISSYLNLIPSELLDEENKEQGSINKAFNKGIKEGISNQAFVLSYRHNLVKCEDIVIDETGITKALKGFGSKFFYNIKASKKELPFFLVDTNKLSYKYLNIEQFKGEDLLNLLKDEENQEFLRSAINELTDDLYLEFLNWFNVFAKKYDLDLDLAQKFPVFKINGSIYSLNEINGSPNLIINIAKYENIKNILKILNYELSSFKLDDYENLWEKLDAFIIKEIDFYAEIAQNELIATLNPTEKATLISFITGLDKVGDTKYANELSLYCDRNKVVKPLSNLITSSILDLPTWLKKFQMNEKEESSIPESLKKYLITKNNLIEKYFSKPLLFTELITSLTINELDEFYIFVTKQLTDENKETLGLKDLPWIYSLKKNSFIKASEAFFSDNLMTLSFEKYSSIQRVIEKISDEIIPHFKSIPLIKKLALGSKDINLIDSINKEDFFSFSEINDYLDWLESQKEKFFLQNVLITKFGDEYKIEKEAISKKIYSPSKELLKYIENKDVNKIFKVFESDLYTNKRNEIGLIEDDALIQTLIENRVFDAELIHFINSKVSSATIANLVINLDSIEINTSEIIEKESTLFKIIENASKVLTEDKDSLSAFRNLIKIDDQPLLESAISSDITFWSKEGDVNKKKDLKIKLFDVLPKYKDKTYSLNSLINLFSDINITKLKVIFEPEKFKVKKIFKELHELELDYFDPYKTFFLLNYKDAYPDEDIFKEKQTFVSVFETNYDLYQNQCIQLLELCRLQDHYIGFLDKILFPDFNPANTILSIEYSLKNEIPPIWIQNYLISENSEDKLKFLKLLGIHDECSPIVILRKALLENTDLTNINWGNINNKGLYINTLIWLQNLQKNGKLKIQESTLLQIYNKALSLEISIKEIPIPVVSKINPIEFEFQEYDQKIEYHLLTEKWGSHEEEVFQHLKDEKYAIVKSFIPNTYSIDLSVKSYDIIEELDTELIMSNIVDFSEPFYQSWARKKEFVIKVYYNDEIPYKIKYGNINLMSFLKGNYVQIKESHIVANSKKVDIPISIRNHMPVELYNSLAVHKEDFIKKQNDEINFTPEQISAWKQLFDNDIPESYKKNYNLAALVAALEALPREGFIVNKAILNLTETHEYAQIEPVFKVGDEETKYTIMCRSTRQGLLYMTASAWERLSNETIYLFADFGFGKYKFFESKQEVLNANEVSTDYQILRIETEANVDNVESILNGSFEKSKIWMIFIIKENEKFDSLFYKKYEIDQNYKLTEGVRTDTESISY